MAARAGTDNVRSSRPPLKRSGAHSVPALVVLMGGRELFTNPVTGEEAAGRGVHGFWVGTFSQIFIDFSLLHAGSECGMVIFRIPGGAKIQTHAITSYIVELRSIRVVMVV